MSKPRLKAVGRSYQSGFRTPAASLTTWQFFLTKTGAAMFFNIIKRLGDLFCICFAVLMAPFILCIVLVSGLVLNSRPHNDDVNLR
jgi:hypothetical protein